MASSGKLLHQTGVSEIRLLLLEATASVEVKECTEKPLDI